MGCLSCLKWIVFVFNFIFWVIISFVNREKFQTEKKTKKNRGLTGSQLGCATAWNVCKKVAEPLGSVEFNLTRLTPASYAPVDTATPLKIELPNPVMSSLSGSAT